MASWTSHLVRLFLWFCLAILPFIFNMGKRLPHLCQLLGVLDIGVGSGYSTASASSLCLENNTSHISYQNVVFNRLGCIKCITDFDCPLKCMGMELMYFSCQLVTSAVTTNAWLPMHPSQYTHETRHLKYKLGHFIDKPIAYLNSPGVGPPLMWTFNLEETVNLSLFLLGFSCPNSKPIHWSPEFLYISGSQTF